MPSVAVVIPTYNRRGPLAGALDSVLAQSVRPAQIIVVDDGSVDDTAAMLRSDYADTVTCIRQENRGVSAARNRGIEAAETDLIAFLDSDDRWRPGKLELQLRAMRDEAVVLSATNWTWADAGSDAFSAQGLAVEPPFATLADPLVHLARPGGHGILVQTAICRTTVLKDLKGFDTSFRITEDNELFFRMARTGKFALLPEVLLVRQADVDDAHLTNEHSVAWRRENLGNMIGIIGSALEAASASAAARTALGQRQRQLQIDLAKLLAAHATPGEARALCRDVLRHGAMDQAAVKAIIGLALPGVLGAREKRRWSAT